MPIDPAALEALRLLLDIAGPDRVVVIGASVPIVLIDQRYGLAVGRTTRDVDVVVRATSWEEYEDLKRRLLAAGFRQARVPHRLEYGPAELDLIPYSRTLAPGDALEWPGQDRVMSTRGFEEAFESARPEQVGDLVVPMASVAACVLLKFVSYNDRRAERVRDLIDIVHCFELYGSEPDPRRYEIGEPEVDGTPVSYDEAGAYLLGQEVAALARRGSLARSAPCSPRSTTNTPGPSNRSSPRRGELLITTRAGSSSTGSFACSRVGSRASKRPVDWRYAKSLSGEYQEF